MGSAAGSTSPTLPSHRMATLLVLSRGAPAATATPTPTTSSTTQEELLGPPFSFDLHKTAIPGLDAVKPPQIESECMVDVSMLEAPATAVEAQAVAHEADPEKEVEQAVVVETVLLQELQEQRRVERDCGAVDMCHSHTSDATTSPSAADTDSEAALLTAPSTASSSPSKSRSPSLAASPLPHAGLRQQQRQSPQASAPEAAPEASRHPQERMITISATELERWQQRVVAHIENHFSITEADGSNVLDVMPSITDEQLKRIAEFGRAHANLLVEAKEYVYNIETQLTAQFEKERAEIRAQAEAYVAQVQLENQQLRSTIDELQHQIVLLRLPSRRNRIAVADDEDEDGGDDDDEEEDNEMDVQADVAVEEDAEEVSSDSKSSSCGSPDVEIVEVKIRRKSKQLRHDDREDSEARRPDRRKKGAKLLLLRDADKDSHDEMERAACEVSADVSVSSMMVDEVGEAG